MASYHLERVPVSGRVVMHYNGGGEGLTRAHMTDVWIVTLNGVPQWVAGTPANGRETLTPWGRVAHLEITP